MKERILLVEDDDVRLASWKRTITGWVDAQTEIILARSLTDVHRFAKTGDVAHCVLDLGLPRALGEESVGIDGDDNCDVGFEALEFICKHNPWVEVSIVSAFTEVKKVAKTKSKLAVAGLPIRRVEDKSRDPDYMDRIRPDIMGLDEISPLLEAVSIQAIHPLERRLARRLWVKAGKRYGEWPAPIVVLRGEPRSGKDAWTRAFISFIDAQRPNPDRVSFVNYDLGQLAGESAGDSGKRDLFGSRGYGGGHPDSAGVFEMASAYRRGGHLVQQLGQDAGAGLARSTDTVDYDACNVAWLNELGNLPGSCQKLMLTLLDSNPGIGGTVIPVGSEVRPIRIGCPIVFTTNADIEANRVPSDAVIEPGQLREDLYQRLEPDEWLRVPSITDLGYDTFVCHLSQALCGVAGREVEISVSSNDLIREAFSQELTTINMQTVKSIVSRFVESGSDRLKDEHVLPALRIHEIKGGAAGSRDTVSPDVEVHWGIEEFENAELVSQCDKEYYLLKFFLNAPNRTFRADEVMGYIDDGDELAPKRVEHRWRRYTEPHALSAAVSRLRKKINKAEIVRQSKLKLLPRGYGVRIMGAAGD